MVYAIIDFTKTAKKYCTFDIWNIKIYIYSDDGFLIEDRPYNDAELEELRENKIPFVFKLDTSSCNVPDDYLFLARLKVE